MVFEFSFLEKEDEQACVDWNRKYKLIPWEGQEEGFQGHLVTLYRDGSCSGVRYDSWEEKYLLWQETPNSVGE